MTVDLWMLLASCALSVVIALGPLFLAELMQCDSPLS